MADAGFSLGGHTEGLPETHFGFSAAAARADADSHLTEAASAAIKQRDSANTVNVRPNQYVTVDATPFA